jgi:hypothetical protein
MKGGDYMSNNNIDNELILEPLVYEPTVGDKPGTFIDMGWDLVPKKNGDPVKDLFLVTELEEKNELGQPVQVRQSFNMLPGGRGLSAYKRQMESFLGKPLTRLQLAQKPDRALVVGKRVIIVYKTDHLGHVVFDKYLPGKAAQPVAAASAAPVAAQPAVQPPVAA